MNRTDATGPGDGEKAIEVNRSGRALAEQRPFSSGHWLWGANITSVSVEPAL